MTIGTFVLSVWVDILQCLIDQLSIDAGDLVSHHLQLWNA